MKTNFILKFIFIQAERVVIIRTPRSTTCKWKLYHTTSVELIMSITKLKILNLRYQQTNDNCRLLFFKLVKLIITDLLSSFNPLFKQ